MTTLSHKLYGQTQESIAAEWDRACRHYRNPALHILGILSDVQHQISTVRDPDGRLIRAQHALNKAKLLIDEKLVVKNLTGVVD